MAGGSSYGVLFALVLIFVGAEAGSYCYKRGSSYSGYGRVYSTYQYTYCPYGCCGSGYNEYCCSSSVGLIVGCVIAGIAGLCVIIALVCCCIKKQGHSGRVVGPVSAQPNRANVTVVYAGSSSMGQPHPQYGMQPVQPPVYATKQAYGQPPPAYGQPPPAYNYTDPGPGYPPGQVNQPPSAPVGSMAPVAHQAPAPGFNVPPSSGGANPVG